VTLNIADSIAARLNETEETPVRTIERIIKVLADILPALKRLLRHITA
jgi:hypothetical protein